MQFFKPARRRSQTRPAIMRRRTGCSSAGVCPDGKAPTGLPGNAVVVAAGGTYIAVSADGVKINGNVTVTGTLSAGGIEMTTHTHQGDSGGTTGGPQ